ncbi:S-adenosyl-L-methionine-dependent methyltransferase [Lactarius quietus]|nr:S-adenosyl-L-methionine-dependent methyltransferase [Lactarius quietus]
MCIECVPPELLKLLPQDHDRFYRLVGGRRCNSLNKSYVMPADEDELRRFELFHRMIRFVFGNKIYVGPVEKVLSPDRDTGGEKLRVLDMGTGGGLWAVDMADEFPHVEVTGVDLAPLQPRMVPTNCTFELCDLEARCLPYPSNSYDVVHARNMHSGIHDYPHFLHELTRILRPGGVLILIEFDLRPIADGKFASAHAKSGIPGWCALAEEIQRALTLSGVDVTVPRRMGKLVHDLGWYDQVFQQHADIPVGFWPKDPTLLTVGQLAWMESDLLILAVRPLLLSSGLSEKEVKMLTEAAQRDLYFPLVHIENRLHVVHAIKRRTT